MDKRQILSLPAVEENDKRHYFCGYYDKCPWDLSHRYILAHSVDCGLRKPSADDAISLGIIDVSENGDRTFQPITHTSAWSWQQGAMLQWWPGDAENCIVFNDRREGRFVGIIRNIHSGWERVLEQPVATVSRDGAYALSLNYSRLADERPGYGYEGIPDNFADEEASDNDGIHLINMNTGKAKLVISLARIRKISPNVTMSGVRHWFNHLLFSPNGRRFIFLHRWRRKDDEGHYTRMFTANIDGSDIYCLNDHDMTSHFDWRDDETVIAWAKRFNIGDRYFLFGDRSDKCDILGDAKLTPFGDGHCTYMPDRQWLLTDSYPDGNGNRHLIVYNPSTDKLVELGAFYSQPWPTPMRCDLHPRWSRDGSQVCFDSSHEGPRRIYVVNVKDVTRM